MHSAYRVYYEQIVLDKGNSVDYAQYKTLEFRRKFLVLVGAKITVHPAGSDQLVGFIGMKAWKLKEDIRLYTDETQQHELLRIHARTIIDFGATYDVVDSSTNQTVYSLRRKGLKSTFVRDHWDIQDTSGNTIGEVQETSSGLAFARRYIGIIPFVGPVADLLLAFAPQTYRISTGNAVVATITHHKNPVLVKMTLDTSMAQAPVDPRLTMAVTALLSTMDAAKS